MSDATVPENAQTPPTIDDLDDAPIIRTGFWARVGDVIAIALPAYVVLNFYYPLPPLQERGIFAMLVVGLVFARSAAKDDRLPWLKAIDGLLLAATVASFGYVVFNYGAIAAAPTADSTNRVLGLIAIAVSIEATRRALSGSLAVIVLVVLAYGLFGDLLPRDFAGHGGYSVDRIIVTTFLGTEGMFGIVTYTLFKFIFLFVLFGQLLQRLGALDFVMTFSRAMLGRVRGGPAMVSVVSSGMMGSISGSAVANTMVTGSVTIPLMKRLGFKPHVAGGMEAAASAGGQFLPPVMGAAAFLMAVVVGVPYLEVVRAAVIPALVYFIAMLVAVYTYARRDNIAKEDPATLPKMRDAFRDLSGVIFFLGLGTLIYLLVQRNSATFSALAAMAIMIVVGMFSAKSRLNVRRAAVVMRDTSDSFAAIGVAGPSVGVIVGVFLLTGIATRFASLIVGFTGENLPLLLIFTMIVSILLGVGLPTTVAYLILALTAAPALVLLGVDVLAAHMFIFFAGMMAMITPPVGLASFAAATIAKTSFWKTGIMAFLIGLPAYLVPYAFVYDQALLGDGTPSEIVVAAISTTIGVSFMAIAVIGRFSSWETYIGRGVLFISALLLIVPTTTTDVIGVLAGSTVCVLGLMWARRRAALGLGAPAPEPPGPGTGDADGRTAADGQTGEVGELGGDHHHGEDHHVVEDLVESTEATAGADPGVGAEDRHR
ncbi:MAG: TRAP transporter fused permease subunit [Nitriliruptoraceae bacterium]|nr:TRAP transporter fused permease subunit [Nitriliruptoraceae bacterium]